MKTLKYSVLYYRSQQFMETIPLGILYSDVDNKLNTFIIIPNAKDKLEKYKQKIYVEITMKFLMSTKVECKKPSFDIYAFTKFFINDFYFDDITEISYSDWDNTLKDLEYQHLKGE